jgi:hypothetical protein
MIRTALLAFFLLPLFAAESPANGIAAKVIRERAAELEHRGQRPVAEQMRVLADGLASGTVSLSDAALVMQIALAGSSSTAAPALTPEQRRAAIASAAKTTSILDSEPPSVVTTAPGLDTTKVDTAKVDERALAIPVATTVLVASYVGEPKSLLVMIGAGTDQQITQGQRFQIKRGDLKIAVVSASQVKEHQTICLAIPGTLAEGAEIKPGDAVVPE